MKREKLYLDLGMTPDKNIDFIIDKARMILRGQRRINDSNELWSKLYHLKDENLMLYIINQYVELVDINKDKILTRKIKQGELIAMNQPKQQTMSEMMTTMAKTGKLNY